MRSYKRSWFEQERINTIIINQYNKKDQCLSLNENASEWVEVLCQRDWSSLRSIDLRNCKINNDELKIISRMKWPNLQKLQLYNNLFTKNGLMHLSPKRWQNLQTLQINNNKIGSEGSKLLTKFYMPNLQKLTLNSCQIGNEGFNHLVKGNWKKLKKIWTHFNGIFLDGLSDIRLGNWDQLKFISIGNRSIFNNQSLTNPIQVLSFLDNKATQIYIDLRIMNTEISETIDQIINTKFQCEISVS